MIGNDSTIDIMNNFCSFNKRDLTRLKFEALVRTFRLLITAIFNFHVKLSTSSYFTKINWHQCYIIFL